MGYLVAAYALVLLAWAGYALWLGRRRRALLAALGPEGRRSSAGGDSG